MGRRAFSGALCGLAIGCASNAVIFADSAQAKRRRSLVIASTTTAVVTPTPKAGSGATIRYSTFWEFCETKRAVVGSAPFAGKGPHPIIFSIQQASSARFTADSHYLGNAAFTDVDPPRYQLVGCISRTSEGKMIRTCTIQIDKANVAVPLFAATYRLDVFEAASATPLTSVDIGSINICPLVVAVDPKQPKIFAAPADAPIARTVLPLVKG